MSYTGSVNGYFTIDPPLKWAEIKESRFYLEDKPDSRDDPGVVLRVERSDQETDDGVSIVFTCSMALPWRDSFDCRDLEKDTKALADEMEKIGRTVRGQMVVNGEWAGDIWRVIADEQGVRKEEARFQWPDGTPVQFG